MSESTTKHSISTEYPQVHRLLTIMEQLRHPQTGCPWDLQQDFQSIVPYTIEEAYEVADAIESGDMDDVKDELGDLLFQVVFYAQLGKEQRHFDFEQVAKTIGDKLVRRHPHVFAENVTTTVDQVAQSWEAIKKQERQRKQQSNDLVLDNIPAGLAPLIKAQKLQKRCAKVGFDWPSYHGVLDKIKEEIDEVTQELDEVQRDPAKVEDELGDLLFAVVNLARHLDVDADRALRKANNKFQRRFNQLERNLKDQGQSLENTNLQQLEQRWQQVKTTETD